MDRDILLVLAGGLVGIAGGVVTLILERWWDRGDRRRAYDARALDAAVKKLMGWQDLAVRLLGSGDIEAAHARLLELDALWESDFDLIPDQEATRELLALSKAVYASPGQRAKSTEPMSRLIFLLDRVIKSAQEKRRTLA